MKKHKVMSRHLGLPNVSALLLALAAIAVSTSVQAAPASGVQHISFGEGHSCVATHGGELLCWGHNKNGQIGNGASGDTIDDIVVHPTQIIASGVTAVSAGYAHTCAVASGALQCWGWNRSGQVGNGIAGNNVLRPTQVIAGGVTAIAAGGMHTCAVVSGALSCWGHSASGELGNGVAGGNVLMPTQVIANGVTAVSAGGHNTCAVVRDALYCWGDNRSGQVGIGTAGGNVLSPKQVFASGVTAVSVQGANTCAVVNGALHCWGKNHDGIIDPNASSDVLSPKLLIAGGVTAATTGGRAMCAVVSGALQCWGRNSMNVIGNGGDPGVVRGPKQMIAGEVTAVVTGAGYTCAIVNEALRCRGYHGYLTAAWPKASLPFDLSEGDLTTMDGGAAETAKERERIPGRIAKYLQGRLIAHDNAVYSASNVQGSLKQGVMDLRIDVTPLYRIRRPLETKGTPGTGADDGAVVPADARCGETSGLPSQLNARGVSVLTGNQFVNLRTALKDTIREVPPEHDGYWPDPLGIGDIDLKKIQACAETINAEWNTRPFAAINIHSNDVQSMGVTPTRTRSWTVPPSWGRYGITHLTVDPKAGATEDFSMEAQTVSVMRCGDLLLDQWKQGLSSAWALGRGEQKFNVPQEILQAEWARFPAYTLLELRRAIQAENGRDGLASVEEAKSCSPITGGDKFTVRYRSNVVQEIYYPRLSDIPSLAESGAQACKSELPMLALRVANDLGYPIGAGVATCKPWPGDPGRSIVALANLQQGSGFSKPPMPDEGFYDLDVLVVKTDSRQILQRHFQKSAFASDAARFDGITLDIARYELAPGVRAFGVRASFYHGGITSFSDETIALYVPQGGNLKRVLGDLSMAHSWSERGGECSDASETKRTLAVARTGSHGYADLVLSERRVDQKTRGTGNNCEVLSTPHFRRYLLRFDGNAYVVPIELQDK